VYGTSISECAAKPPEANDEMTLKLYVVWQQAPIRLWSKAFHKFSNNSFCTTAKLVINVKSQML